MVHEASVLPPALEAILRGLPYLALAYSGGVDSRFLALAAREAGCQVLLLHGTGPHVDPMDTEIAVSWAAAEGFALEILQYDPLPLPGVASNDRQRCYQCKLGLFRRFQGAIGAHGAEWTLCDGSHADDAQAFRPGRRALAELGIISPLAMALLRKADIRSLGQAMGLSQPDQRARPCMLTRLNYGLAPDAMLLRRLAKCERALENILPREVDFRLRLTPAPILQVSGDIQGAWPKAQGILAENEFGGAELLLSPHISGFFDKP